MRSVIARWVAVLVTALLAIGLLSAPAHAEPAVLSGTITSDATGEPVTACVTVYDLDYGYVTGTCSDELGVWSVEVDSGVAVKVEVSVYDGRHIGEWAQEAASFEEAQSYTAPASVDVGVQLGGTIGGSLTRADGSPAEGTSVTVYRASDLAPVAYAGVGAAGGDEWFATVAPGEYVVEYWLWEAHQWATGQLSAETATRFLVSAGETTRVDDRFLGAATVRGTVLSDVTGEPIGGACVQVLQPSDDPDNLIWAGEGCADSDGNYVVELGQTGTFIAQFSDPTGTHVAEYTGDTRVLGDAAPFTVTRQSPAVVGASLARAAVITGRAVDAKSGAPIAQACPHAYLGHAGDFVPGQVGECSGDDGRWSLKGIPGGSYAVSITVSSETRRYATTWAFKAASQESSSLITVGTGATASVRDIQLMPGGTIAGVVTGPGGEPVADAYVSIDSGYSGRAGGPTGPVYARTDEAGRYTLHGVPQGDHSVFVEPPQWGGLAPLWSGNADRREDAVMVKVKANRTTAYDAVLKPGATITGTVLEADGQPTADYWVGIVRTTTGDYIGDFDVFNGNTFSSTSLPAGSFTLELRRYTEGGDEEIVWYDAATSLAAATVVRLRRGETQDITIHLP